MKYAKRMELMEDLAVMDVVSNVCFHSLVSHLLYPLVLTSYSVMIICLILSIQVSSSNTNVFWPYHRILWYPWNKWYYGVFYPLSLISIRPRYCRDPEVAPSSQCPKTFVLLPKTTLCRSSNGSCDILFFIFYLFLVGTTSFDASNIKRSIVMVKLWLVRPILSSTLP